MADQIHGVAFQPGPYGMVIHVDVAAEEDQRDWLGCTKRLTFSVEEFPQEAADIRDSVLALLDAVAVKKRNPPQSLPPRT